MLPPLFGNFEQIRETLTNAPEKEEFTFVVIGDTRGRKGIFENISKELHKTPADFWVLLGDCTDTGTEFNHRYFLKECVEEYDFTFPVFYIVGNHDIDLRYFPISRFEELYGPTIFSFEYQNCLFIGLRITTYPELDQPSIDFMKSWLDKDTTKYRKIFVFMHTPPRVPSFDSRKFNGPEELISLCRQLKVDYVFAGHYHGYARTEYDNTTYIVTGGGGADLHESKFPQFHHAMVVRVGKDYVSEQIIPSTLTYDLQDYLEKRYLNDTYLWLSQNRIAAVVINVIMLFALIGIGRFLYKKYRIKKT